MLIISPENIEFVKICESNDIIRFIEFSKNLKAFKKVTDFSSGFILICEHKNKEFINLLTNNKRVSSSLDFEHIFYNLIALESLEMIKYLKDFEPSNQQYLNRALTSIGKIGNLSMLEYFITHQLTKESLTTVLNTACANGHLEMIKFLFNSFDLDIHNNYDLPLRIAAREKKLEVVKYLLTSEKLKEKSNPHALEDDLYISAIMSSNVPVLDYLENEYKLPESQKVKEYKKTKVMV